ncbi:MAG: hypothetical protein QM813_27465 [Verrucomicrobiota bacterium]
MTDIHATIMRQMGLDSRRLEIPGRKRLDIDHGKPIDESWPSRVVRPQVRCRVPPVTALGHQCLQSHLRATNCRARPVVQVER